MDNLETPYDEETEYIECTVCEKSLRGETLYKIHLTTPAHTKKEDALVAAGHAVRHRTVPEFKDIVQYLDYLQLDEPIIGLSFLDEVPCNDPQAGPRYLCRLCHHTANLAEMVHHVIGRKHRQKYVELKRQDLVTWDKESIITQGGKIIRARAEIIERQDGRGSPMALVRRGTEGKLNISRVPPRERQNRTRGQRFTEHNVPPLLPELKGYSNEYSNRMKYATGYLNTTDESDLNRGRWMYHREDPLGRDYMDKKLHRADYRESDMHRQEYMDLDNCRKFEEEYVDDSHNFSPPRVVPEPAGVPRYSSREKRPHGQAQHIKYYPDVTPQRRPFPENDPLKEFYTEEVRRRGGHSAEYQPSQRAYQGEHQWSQEREPGRHDSMIRAGRQGFNETEAKRGGISTPGKIDQTQDLLFNIIADYRLERMEHQKDMMSNSGPGRTGPSTSQRQLDVTRTMSDIPEPFRRFLKGDTNDESSKRKRKNRFSDATAEEVEITKDMFIHKYGPPDPKFGGCPRAVGGPEILGPHLDHYTESQSPHCTESYTKGGFGTEGVFDMLKNIEIENAEEADFLKNKLCSLLIEFKSKKSEKNMQNSQGRAFTNITYNNLKADTQRSSGYNYETSHREDSDLRRQDSYFKEDHGGRGWKEHGNKLIDYHHVGEPRYSNRSYCDENFGWTEMSGKPHSDEPHYSERSQEPIHPHDYQPETEDFDSHSSAAPLNMGQEPKINKMHMDSRYSKNLDKITSTLLELVARK